MFERRRCQTGSARAHRARPERERVVAGSFVKSLSPAAVPPTLRSPSCTDSRSVARLLHVSIFVVTTRDAPRFGKRRLDSKRTREVRNSNCSSRTEPSVRPSISFARLVGRWGQFLARKSWKPKNGENLALHEVRANSELDSRSEARNRSRSNQCSAATNRVSDSSDESGAECHRATNVRVVRLAARERGGHFGTRRAVSFTAGTRCRRTASASDNPRPPFGRVRAERRRVRTSVTSLRPTSSSQ